MPARLNIVPTFDTSLFDIPCSVFDIPFSGSSFRLVRLSCLTPYPVDPVHPVDPVIFFSGGKPRLT